MSKKILRYTFLLGIITFLVACGAVNNNDQVAVAENGYQAYNDNELENQIVGGDLVWLSNADAISLDPHRANDIPSMVFQSQVFEGLVTFNQVGELIPVLAYSFYNISPEVWEFNLRQGVYFHDGTPFNASAVIISFERILDPEFGAAAANIKEMITEITAIDEYTVHITTEFPFAPLPNHLTPMGSFIISPSAIEEELNGGLTVNENPIGTGPFIFQSRDHGDNAVFTRNDNYWGSLPYVDSVTIRVIPESATRLAVLESGEGHGFTATAIELPSVREMQNTNYITVVSAATEYIGFNMTEGPLANQQVRQAIAMAINIEEMMELMAGLAMPASSMASSVIAFQPSPAVTLPEFDLDGAIYLLSQTPYADGFTLNFWYNDGSAIRGPIGELTQFYLSELGIDVIITSMEWGAYQAAIGALEHDMFVLNWVGTTGDADRVFHPLFHSDNIGAAGNRFNYNSPLADELIIGGRQEQDTERRAEIYEELAELLAYDLPLLPLWHIVTPHVFQGIDGLTADFRGVANFSNVRVLD